MNASHHYATPLLRIAFAFIGIALLWYGSAQLTVAGLIVMLCGLVAAVGAVESPRLGLLGVRAVHGLAQRLLHP